MTAPPPRIGAVIVHYGSAEPTRRALESVRASRGVELRIALVDHGPDDGGPLAAAACAAGAGYLRPAVNGGFAAGLNLGIAALREPGPRPADQPAPELFLFLNHDATLDPDAAHRLALRFEAEPRLGIAGPLVLDLADPGRIWNAGSEIDWPRGRPRSLQHGLPAAAARGDPYPVGFVCGCAAMVRASLLDEMGPLSEEWFLYFEDADLSFRARRAGWRVEVEPRARAFHEPHRGVSAALAAAEYCRTRNRLLFSRRWAPPGAAARWCRLWFALGRLVKGGAAARGARDALRGASGPPPAGLRAEKKVPKTSAGERQSLAGFDRSDRSG